MNDIFDFLAMIVVLILICIAIPIYYILLYGGTTLIGVMVLTLIFEKPYLWLKCWLNKDDK